MGYALSGCPTLVLMLLKIKLEELWIINKKCLLQSRFVFGRCTRLILPIDGLLISTLLQKRSSPPSPWMPACPTVRRRGLFVRDGCTSLNLMSKRIDCLAPHLISAAFEGAERWIAWVDVPTDAGIGD
ncbi:unnamed protein product [Hydatigera taeniaeformis]|uniref:Uncharacterized protein n=1 Tax=Hydatigena taeniaeformis TaxID=6205 RepID=A0A0R3X768_HYDTA|nr:unnamed protein product [Hydatigera taeniaeformis]